MFCFILQLHLHKCYPVASLLLLHAISFNFVVFVAVTLTKNKSIVEVCLLGEKCGCFGVKYLGDKLFVSFFS
jgi:hypothetical protein